MADGKDYSLKTINEIRGATGFLRRRSNALLVLTITVDDVAISTDDNLQPIDAVRLIRDELNRLLGHLQARQAQKRVKRERNV